jgi:hypothetical protein
MTWQVLHTLAAIAAALISLFSALLAWSIYRKANSNTVIDAIKAGDKAIVERLTEVESEHDERLRHVETDVTTIKAAQEHGLQRADVDKLHHRINVLVREVSGVETLARQSAGQIDRIQAFLMGNKK